MAAAAAVTGTLTDVSKLELLPCDAKPPMDSRVFLLPVSLCCIEYQLYHTLISCVILASRLSKDGGMESHRLSQLSHLH